MITFSGCNSRPVFEYWTLQVQDHNAHVPRHKLVLHLQTTPSVKQKREEQCQCHLKAKVRNLNKGEKCGAMGTWAPAEKRLGVQARKMLGKKKQ